LAAAIGQTLERSVGSVRLIDGHGIEIGIDATGLIVSFVGVACRASG